MRREEVHVERESERWREEGKTSDEVIKHKMFGNKAD